jgi:PAS domain S-box-containing protein
VRPCHPLPPPTARPTTLDWKRFVWRIGVPTVVALALLVGPLFWVVLPAIEDALLSRKRETIRELTRSASSLLEEYERDVQAGRLSLEAAQQAAGERIRDLRYGSEGKDYFWITDLQPRMVMHPYRTDLNGKDVSDFQDQRGHRVFVEFVRLVQAKREGYLEYVWQWKDDPQRLVAKQAYVRLFEPWGWVIGTGIYLDDVNAEISQLTARLLRVSVLLAVAVGLLLLYLAQQSFRLERRRSAAEASLRESHERYRALVEVSKEGTVLLLDGRSVFANQTFLELSGYRANEWPLMAPDEVFELAAATAQPRPSFTTWMQAELASGARAVPTRARVQRRDGGSTEVLLSVEPLEQAGHRGAIVLVRDLGGQQELLAALRESQARLHAIAENLPLPVLRASVAAPFRVLETNAAARRLFGVPEVAVGSAEGEVKLLEVFEDGSALTAFVDQLRTQPGGASCHLRLVRALGGARVVVTAVLAPDDEGAGAAPCFDATVEDVTEREQALQARDALITDLQSALLSLGEPVRRVMHEPRSVGHQTTVLEAAALMTRHDTSALLVRGPAGEPLGLVTDRDLRVRVLAKGQSPTRPVFELMSAPLHTVTPATQGHAALALMRDKHIQHLLVVEEDGRVAGLVHGKDLLHVERYPVALLIHSMHEAEQPEALVPLRARLPLLVKGLVDSGAKSRHVCRAITGVNDALTQRLLVLDHERHGAPPAPFAFLALGSEGREEQTLSSDQDTALVFAPSAAQDERQVQLALLAMAERVSEQQAAAGLRLCEGGVMARNARWCQSLPGWRLQLSEWLTQAEPQDVLEFSTVFDFRCVHGEPGLAAALKSQVFAQLEANPAFLGHLARVTLQYRRPTGLFGSLPGGPQGALDLKEAHALMVHIARLYALRHQVHETSTVERVERLQALGAFSASSAAEFLEAHEFLVTLRLRHQADQFASGRPFDNRIDPKRLTQLEQGTLKQVLAQVVALQKKVSFDFLGAA